MKRFLERLSLSAASLTRATGILVLLLALDARAGNYCNNPVPPCDPNDPTSACYKPPEPPPECEPLVCDKCTKSPCYAASGVYVTTAVDLRLRTVGFPIEVSRRYQTSHLIDGPSGFGWTSSLSTHLYHAAYLKAAPDVYQREADIRLPDGMLYRFVEGTGGSFSAPEGRFDTLVRNADGTFDLRLQKSRSHYAFAADGNLISMTDDYGNMMNWTYAGDRLSRVTDAGSGRYIDVYWGADGRISDVSDLTGRTIHYDYDSQGHLVGVTNPLSQTTAYTYVTSNAVRLLSTIADHWGRNITTITYDTTGRVHSYVENGETYTYTYAYNGNKSLTAKTDSAGNRWQYVYNSDGIVTEIWPPGTSPSSAKGPTTNAGAFVPMRMTYDTNGQLQAKTDQTGVKTTTAYNSQGNATTATFDSTGTLAVRFDYAYDSNFPERLTSITPFNPATGVIHPDWQTQKWDYYPPGSAAPGAIHHIYEVANDGTSTHAIATFTYDTQGRVLTVADQGGNLTSYTYDAQGNLETRTAPSNNSAGTLPTTSYTFDALGRVLTVTNPEGRVTTYTWDALDRIKTATPPKPAVSSTLTFTSSYFYDEFDSTTQLLFTRMVDPNGRATRVGRDQYKRSIRSVGPAGDVVRREYTRNLLTGEWDANDNKTTYTYDALLRMDRITYPDGTFVQHSWNDDNTLASKRDRAGQLFLFTYDAFKRMLVKSYPGGGAVTRTFQGQKLQQIVDSSGSPSETHTFGWDDWFRLTSNVQAGRGTLTFSYTADGRIASRAVTGGATTTLVYWPDGTVRSMDWSPVTGSFTFDYSLAGRLQHLTLPNGQTRNYAYDDQGRLTELQNLHPSTGVLAEFDYGYDIDPATGTATLLGRRTSVTASVPALGLSSAVTNVTYDNRYFLSSATYPAGAPYNGATASWTYDGEGNRTSESFNGATSPYSYTHLGTNPLNGPRLLSDGANAYLYDANGNVTGRSGSRGTLGLTYDADNLLRNVSGDVTASFDYDYAGRRTVKTESGVSTAFLYDDVHAISETTGGVRTEYLFGPGLDQALAMVRDGSIYYFSVDALDSVVTVNDAAGAIKASYAWDVWGKALAVTDTVGNSIGFTGRELSQTGLHYYRFRNYEPATGRFFGEDPDGFVGGLNSYLYALGDPLLYTDPLGLHVQVCYYADAAMGFGHVGFGTSGGGGGTHGFYNDGNPFSGPGQVLPDNQKDKTCIWIPSPPEKDRCMEDCRDERASNPGKYKLFSRQCTSFVRDCLIRCGLPAGDYTGPQPYPFFMGLPRVH